MFWWVWTLFRRNHRDGVDVKDVCPSPNQIGLDDFEFVGGVGLNRGSDAIFARYVLGHLPCPPCILRVEAVWRADVEAQFPPTLLGLAASNGRHSSN
jgi:hypothetical protein